MINHAFTTFPKKIIKLQHLRIIDVSGNDVNKSRFIKELNGSIAGSWASKIKSKDEVLIYMVDHGSTVWDPSGNATFHFDTGGFVTEQEVDNLLKTFKCKRLILMADMCFAGNFIQPFLNSAPNRILIGSSAPPRLSWYWVMATVNHYAGSFFFHPLSVFIMPHYQFPFDTSCELR